MRILGTIVFLFFCNTIFSQNNWKLIYENDAEGNGLNGNLENLIASIHNGEQIRIYFSMGSVESGYC